MTDESTLATVTAPTASTAAPTRIGHVALRVADLERARDFYCDVLGLDLVAWGPESGVPLAVLGLESSPLSVVVMAFESVGGTAAPAENTGLAHVALLLDGPEALAAVTRRLDAAGFELRAADHHATVSVYLDDPEGNGLELYYERPRERWFDAEGRVVMVNDPLELDVAAG